MRVSGERGEGDAFVSENRDDDDAKRKKKRKRRRENGGALEWKDIVAGTKKSEEDESFSHHHHSSDFEDQEEEEKEEKEEGTDLDALMKTVLAGRERKGKKMKTEEAFKKSRKREASRLKRELRNVNVKENNRNFERMFIGETLVDGVGRRRRATNTATSAGKMEDDTVEDDNNNSDEKKGWYYPCDWTLKTRATFAKICSLRDDDVSTKWWFLKNNQNVFVVKEFHIISMRTLIALSFVRNIFTNGQTYPTTRSLAGRRRSRRS